MKKLVRALSILLPYLAMPNAAWSEPDISAAFQQAQELSGQGRHSQAFEIWKSMLAPGSAVIGEERYKVIRGMVYREAYRAIVAAGEDCAQVIAWAEKGKTPGPPTHDMAADFYYGAVLMMEGICRYNRQEHELAYESLHEAKHELSLDKGDDAELALDTVATLLTSVESNVILPGDYVTNSGPLQSWIGTVVARERRTLTIKITYSRQTAGGESSAGPIELDRGDCRELSSVSLDAVLKGWKN